MDNPLVPTALDVVLTVVWLAFVAGFIVVVVRLATRGSRRQVRDEKACVCAHDAELRGQS
ncbi:hypothetical protein [Cellulomonas edaphi]|uniref:Uncharacterized protein n=1 Tax=Cellulomonas edaphi TaxID=3053468 RepID=A0ABT7S9S1_9CELL|nr:hypothetical protein [Cellulomons edaphi]MDM7832373.1 hypothetical protein [Cellulomons edaphi]